MDPGSQSPNRLRPTLQFIIRSSQIHLRCEDCNRTVAQEMAIKSSLTKDVRLTGGNTNNKQQLEWMSSDSSKTNSSFRRGSNQGGSDWAATSITSSMHGSTSSGSSSIDQYISGVEVEIQQKTFDKLNSKKLTGFGSLKQSRRTPLLDKSPDNIQKPEPKFTSSGSLRSLRILRSKRATFSSVLKDWKFPEQVNPTEVKVTKSEEVVSVEKLCPYQHCSLHGHHHHYQNLPHKRFPYLKRRSSENQKDINPQIQTTDTGFVKKTEVKVNQKVSVKGKKNKNADDSIEFYAKTRSGPSSEAICDRACANLADIMFGLGDSIQNEDRKLDDSQDSVDTDDGKDENQRDSNASGTKKGKPKGWSYVKKVMLVRRFITELEHAKKHITLAPQPEAEIVSLRCQAIGEKKNSNEWMLDYALQQVVGELARTQKRKVALLVKAFETVAPK